LFFYHESLLDQGFELFKQLQWGLKRSFLSNQHHVG